MAKFSVDPELIRQLADILNQTGLGEIEYAEGERRIRVARPAVAAVAPVLAAAPAAALPAGAAPAGADGAAPANAITAPMVGTVYASPEPGAEPFVRVGDQVKEGQTLLIIEAMKVMNQIRSPRGGKVTQIFFRDGSPVEYGEPLLVVA
jgi:acetyl-CoA carboxylase biotin carboxyl carrier protein